MIVVGIRFITMFGDESWSITNDMESGAVLTVVVVGVRFIITSDEKSWSISINSIFASKIEESWGIQLKDGNVVVTSNGGQGRIQ